MVIKPLLLFFVCLFVVVFFFQIQESGFLLIRIGFATALSSFFL